MNYLHREISFELKTTIIPQKTLLFIDEIQECIPAISSLRYFYEDMPELHVIAAGSLFDFASYEINRKSKNKNLQCPIINISSPNL